MKEKAFSIVELVVVMAIIGILVTIGTVSYVNLQKRTRDDERKADTEIVMTALENFYEKEGRYPSLDEFYERSTASEHLGFKEKVLGLNKSILINPSDKNAPTNRTYSGNIYYNTYSYVWHYPGNTESDINSKINSKEYPPLSSEYYYLPIHENKSSVCWTDGYNCIKYVVGWKSEVNDETHIMKSKYGW